MSKPNKKNYLTNQLMVLLQINYDIFLI